VYCVFQFQQEGQGSRRPNHCELPELIPKSVNSIMRNHTYSIKVNWLMIHFTLLIQVRGSGKAREHNWKRLFPT